MMFTSKKRLAIAVAGAVSLGATVAHAVDFNATTTLQNALAVTVIQDFDIGTVFATTTEASYDDGVGAFTVNLVSGLAETPTGLTDSSLTSLTTPSPAQGSVDAIDDFTLTLPNTSAVDPAEFSGIAGGGTLVEIDPETRVLTDDTNEIVELVHESGDPSVPSLYMMHFTVAPANDGDGTATEAGLNTGVWNIDPAFGVTTYVFNIGATITTQPNATAPALDYQAGVYSGTFTVTAAY